MWQCCEQTLRDTGAVVPIQLVPWSTETHIGTIWKLLAEMLTSSISVAAPIRGQTNCKISRRKTLHWHLKRPRKLWWNSYFCHSWIHGSLLDICRHRWRGGEYKWLHFYREMTDSDPRLQTERVQQVSTSRQTIWLHFLTDYSLFMHVSLPFTCVHPPEGLLKRSDNTH